MAGSDEASELVQELVSLWQNGLGNSTMILVSIMNVKRACVFFGTSSNSDIFRPTGNILCISGAMPITLAVYTV